ncbi:hypothetical protein [Rikenella microfusus]|uniref:hypothetical protein n=1 Tax=Rikenella microfusus TaxID=28139 RepID=UPI0004896068|nr:hypothetical protein [Rikenella microfusus]
MALAGSVGSPEMAPSLNLQIKSTIKMLYPFGFAPTSRSGRAAWAPKPAILKNRINKNRRVIQKYRDSGRAGATPGGGLQLRCACFASAGSGLESTN